VEKEASLSSKDIFHLVRRDSLLETCDGRECAG